MHHARRRPTADLPEGRVGPRARLLLLLLCVAQLMVILDISAVNVALPDIATDLAVAPGRDRPGRSRATRSSFGSLLLLGGRARRRPARPPAPLPHRPRGVHGRLPRHRDGRRRHDALRRPRRPGPRRRAALPRRAVDPHRDLPRAASGRRPRGLGSGRWGRRSDRRPARRDADRAGRLAGDLPHQPPVGVVLAAGATELLPADATRAALARPRCPRCPAGDREHRRLVLRALTGGAPAGRPPRRSASAPRRCPAWPRSRRSSSARRPRCCASSAWATAPSAVASC